MKVCFRTAGSHLGAGLGRVKDDVSAEEEEKYVEAHHAGERDGEVYKQGLLVAEPTKISIAES